MAYHHSARKDQGTATGPLSASNPMRLHWKPEIGTLDDKR